MKNKEFGKQSQREKAAKLKAVIRNRTNGALSNDELDSIIRSISADRQYAILVHTDTKSFCQALVLAHSNNGCDHGNIVFGDITFGNNYGSGNKHSAYHHNRHKTAAAVITRGATERTTHEIHIFVPKTLSQAKGDE